MRLESLVRRRPSAPLVVSFAALFVALGGVGYAATQLPANSVGTAQLQNGSVGNHKLKFNSVGARKIISGAVGAKQVNPTKVQLRVSSSCSTGAISAVGVSGTVACTPTLPIEQGVSAAAVTLPEGGSTVATKSLSVGYSYLILAYPHVVISGVAGQHVEVDCALSVPAPSATNAFNTSITKTLAVDLGSSSQSDAGTIPLVLPVGSGSSGAASSARIASVGCTYTATPSAPAPTVAVDSTLNAIQTASVS